MMPEPIVPGSGYRLRISEVGGDAVRCSNNFYLISSGDGTTGTEASIMVTSPASESVAIAGEEYTVEVRTACGVGIDDESCRKAHRRPYDRHHPDTRCITGPLTPGAYCAEQS